MPVASWIEVILFFLVIIVAALAGLALITYGIYRIFIVKHDRSK